MGTLMDSSVIDLAELSPGVFGVAAPDEELSTTTRLVIGLTAVAALGLGVLLIFKRRPQALSPLSELVNPRRRRRPRRR